MTLKPLVLEATRSHSNSATTFLFEIIPLLIELMAKIESKFGLSQETFDGLN